MAIPKKLYKYEPFTDLTLRNLKRQSVYFYFNDVYDCAITARVQDLSAEQVEIWKNYFLNNNEIHVQVKNELMRMDHSHHEYRERLKKIVSETISQEKEIFISKYGITCLSETNDDLLLWSHYGGRYIVAKKLGLR